LSVECARLTDVVEERVLVGDEYERIGDDAVAPASDALQEVEDARVTSPCPLDTST
jgi:hypothetical protein